MAIEAAADWAVGVGADGKPDILGVSVARSVAEVRLQTSLESCSCRGMPGVERIVADDHAALRAARHAVFPGVKWQRCLFHRQRNAQAYAPG